MDTETMLRRLQDAPRLSLSPEELTELLAAVTIVREEDTCISGMLRILLLGDDTVLVQEEIASRRRRISSASGSRSTSACGTAVAVRSTTRSLELSIGRSSPDEKTGIRNEACARRDFSIS